MNRQQIDEFLKERRNCILATATENGRPVQVPVWFDWHDGKIYISVTTQRAFYRHLQRREHVSVCIDDHQRPVRTVIIDGKVRIIEGDSHWRHTHRILDKYLGAGEQEATLERMQSEPRVILEITPDRVASWTPTPRDREVWRPNA